MRRSWLGVAPGLMLSVATALGRNREVDGLALGLMLGGVAYALARPSRMRGWAGLFAAALVAGGTFYDGDAVPRAGLALGLLAFVLTLVAVGLDRGGAQHVEVDRGESR